jgi:hypothetical protein
MEDRTDESGLRPPGPDTGAPSAEHAPGIPQPAAEITRPAAGSPAPAAEIPAREPPSKNGPVAASGMAGKGPAERRPATGEPRVDAALARLDELPELPVTEHRAVFEHVHRSLSEVLGELDAGLPLGGAEAGDARDAEGADGKGDSAETARGASRGREGAGSAESRPG